MPRLRYPRISATFAIFALFFTSLASAQINFEQSQQYGSAYKALEIISADFNHDGFADIAYPGYTGSGSSGDPYFGHLLVRLNDGQGNYGPEINYDLGNNFPGPLLIGEFNGDGVLDLVIGTAGEVHFFFGNGDGTFRPGPNIATAAGSFAVGDFNNDGKLDLAGLISPPPGFTAADPAGTLDILLSNGDGTFTRKVQPIPGGYWASQYPGTAPPKDYARYLVAGDWNADGKMDLAFVNFCDGCFVQDAVFQMFNDGAANFARASVPAGGGTGTDRLKSADIDLDGKSDIYYRFWGCHTACTGAVVLYSNGDGTAVRANLYSGGSETPNTTDLIAGDFDNDGLIDIAGANQAGHETVNNTFVPVPAGITVFRGLGERKFGSAQHFNTSGEGANSQLQVITGGFINADGRKDLVLGSGTPSGSPGATFSVFLNTSSGATCQYPTSAGVNICKPSGDNTNGSVAVRATGKGVYGPLQRMEVWLDGVKQFQIFNDEVNSSFQVSDTKSHTMEVVAVDFAGQVLKMSVPTAGVGGGNSPDFAISASPQSAAVKRGDAATFTITVAPQNGFNNAVALSCSGLPAGANCAFTPASVTPSGSPVSSTLKITTTAASAMLQATPAFYALSFSSFSFALLGLCWLPYRLRRGKLMLIALLLVLAVVMIQAGCGGGGSKGGTTPQGGSNTPPPSSPPPPGSGGTAVGNYTVTVQANSGSLQHSTNVQLTVQ
jgi:FG-GAP-like repeat